MTTRSLLHLNGTNGSTTYTDAVGVYSWAGTNAPSLTTGTVKFGTAALDASSAGKYISSTLTGTLPASGAGAWTYEFFAQFTSVAGTHGVAGLKGPSGANATYISNRGNGLGQQYKVSLTGAAADFSVIGTKTVWATGTWYHMAMTYDPVAGAYYFYVDGVLDGTISTASTMSGSGWTAFLGYDNQGAGALVGYIDEFRMSDTCIYPGGTTFTVTTTEFGIDTGINPTTGTLVLTGNAPVVTNSGILLITPNKGTLTLTGAAPLVLGVIVPNTGSLALTGVQASRLANEVRTPAAGALALTGASPIMGVNGALVLRAFESTGTAHSGIAATAALNSYSATGEVTTFNSAVGAPSMRKMTGLGYAGYVSKPSLRKYSAIGTVSGAAIGAATLRSYRAQQTSGSPRLRKYIVAAYASSAVAATYRTHVMNTTSNAVTEYTGHRFNSFAQIAGQYYGAGPDGLIRLDGSNDAGTDINWRARTGQIDDKQVGLKRLPEVVMGLRASGPVRVRVYPDDDRYFDYMLPNVKTTTIRQQRVKVGKGMESRWFMVEMQGVTNSAMEMDSMQLNMTPTTRRIG